MSAQTSRGVTWSRQAMETSDDDLINKVEDRIYSYVTEKRVRLEEFFHQFDRLRCRCVTVEQFRRSLHLSGTMVTAQEFQALVRKYSDGPGRVNYRRFCDAVGHVERDLEKKPSLSPTGNLMPPKKTETLPPQQEKIYEVSLMPKLKKIVKERGLILKDYFSDFDPHRNGRVTKSQFKRCLPFELTTQEVDILVAKYEDVIVGDVNYRQLHNDLMVGNPVDQRRAAANPATAPHREIRLLTDMEKDVKNVIRDKRVRVYDFFEDFDKLRSGLVTKPIFTRVLCMAGLEALRDKLTDLADLYTRPGTNMVDYTVFSREMEASPESYHELLQNVVQRMRKEFAARGPAGVQGLVAAFHAADEGQTGTLLPSEFIWVLSSCGLRVTHDDVFAMLDYFDVKNQGVVRYMEFIDAVRGILPPARKQAAYELCRTMDRDGAGDMMLDDLLARFDAHAVPAVLAGEMSPEEATEELATTMPGVETARGRKVSYDDFCKYFALLSASIDSDYMFAQLLWRMFQTSPGNSMAGSPPGTADSRPHTSETQRGQGLSGTLENGPRRQPWASPLRTTARAH